MEVILKNSIIEYIIKKENTKNLFEQESNIQTEIITINNEKIPVFIGEFWTSKQRQANSLHEISYRACFKPQLPNFFIKALTNEKSVVYDPFNGRGTTVLEAALLNRNIIANDINPLSIILSKPRLFIPDIELLKKRLLQIPINYDLRADIDLSMFYHQKTESEIVSLKKYLQEKETNQQKDEIDYWIQMVATNRLTGHSANFFSVYTLPPNQAISPEKQKKINLLKNQKPEYKDTRAIILKKTYDLLKDITSKQISQLKTIGHNALFLNKDARYTNEIPDEFVDLTVTSPPFLDVVQYADDNWLRCWFNNIDVKEVEKKMTITRNIEDWKNVMKDVFKQLFRITKTGGYVAFEVGEVRNGKLKLEEIVAPVGMEVGFKCECIIINKQIFTKTSNIWGVSNNKKGTNTNRIAVFKKL